MRHVFKVGPLNEPEGASAYVGFGSSGLEIVVEPTDDKGVAALQRRTKGERLVCEPALSQCAADRDLAVGELPPEAVAIRAALAVTLDHGASLEPIAPQLALDLITATIELAVAAPWNVFHPDEPVTIRFEPGGREVEGCVMGRAGEARGLALYHHKGSIERALALTADGRSEAVRGLACTSLLLAYDDSFAVDAVRAMTGVAVAPLVFHTARGRASPASETDIAGLVAAMRAVIALAARRRPATGRTIDERVTAHAARGSRAVTEPSIYRGAGRNQPCPCGSGKKFKRCHMNIAEPTRTSGAALHQRDERVVADILIFGARRFGVETLESQIAATFGDHKVSRQLVDPVLAYAMPIEGKPLAAHYLDARRTRIDADDRQWIERQLATRLSVWEVLRVEHGKGIDVVDLITGRRCFVHEVMGSESLLPRHALLGRVVEGPINVFCGIHDSPLGPVDAAEMMRSTRRTGHVEGWSNEVLLIERWREAVVARDRKAASPMILKNTDGHDVVAVEDHYKVAPGGFERAFEALAALEGVLVDERDRKGARLTFTHPGNAVHARWKNTVVGTARLTPTRLVVSAQSVERARALVDTVNDAVGGLAMWKKRTHEEIPAMFGGETMMVDAEAVTSPPSMTDMSRAWLDAPIQALDGRTPRAAVGDPLGRERVHELLKMIEHRHANKPIEGEDPVQLRRELGLDELGAPLPNLDLERAIGAGRKLSEVLLDFARPLIDSGLFPLDERGMRGLLGFAIPIWNAAVVEKTGAAGIAPSELAPIPAEIRAWYDRLVARKQEWFAGDLRLVGHWRVFRQRDRLEIEMESRVTPALQAQLVSAGLLSAD